MTCLDPNRPLRQNCDEIPVSFNNLFLLLVIDNKIFFLSFLSAESISLINSDNKAYDVAGNA